MTNYMREEKLALSVETKELILNRVRPMIKDMIILLALSEGSLIKGYKINWSKDLGLYETIDLEDEDNKIFDAIVNDRLEYYFYEEIEHVLKSFPVSSKEDFYGIAAIAGDVLEDLKQKTNYVNFNNSILRLMDKDEDFLDEYKTSVMETALAYIVKYCKISDKEKEALEKEINDKYARLVSFGDLDERIENHLNNK